MHGSRTKQKNWQLAVVFSPPMCFSFSFPKSLCIFSSHEPAHEHEIIPFPFALTMTIYVQDPWNLNLYLCLYSVRQMDMTVNSVSEGKGVWCTQPNTLVVTMSSCDLILYAQAATSYVLSTDPNTPTFHSTHSVDQPPWCCLRPLQKLVYCCTTCSRKLCECAPKAAEDLKHWFEDCRIRR